QLRVVRLARLARDGAARAGRDIDKIGVAACRRAFTEIEAEAHVLQQQKLPAHKERGPEQGRIERAKHVERRGVKLRMWVALWQEAGEARERADGGKS